ncbi:hypothetical protein C9183_24495 [Escherichia coli]|nr:hypothetical protein C9198_23845 [Escherichia coli]TJG09588.1 hypothetical protein C9183_24495 [Escherichia coli]
MGEWIHRCRQTTTHTFGLPGIGAPVVLNSGYSQNYAHRCRKLWYSPSPDSQHAPAPAESRCHHRVPATPPA